MHCDGFNGNDIVFTTDSGDIYWGGSNLWKAPLKDNYTENVFCENEDIYREGDFAHTLFNFNVENGQLNLTFIYQSDTLHFPELNPKSALILSDNKLAIIYGEKRARDNHIIIREFPSIYAPYFQGETKYKFKTELSSWGDPKVHELPSGRLLLIYPKDEYSYLY